MAENSEKKYASGFNNTGDGSTYYFRDDEAQAEITRLKERIKILEEQQGLEALISRIEKLENLNVFVVQNEDENEDDNNQQA